MNPVEVLKKAIVAVETGTAIHGDTKRSFEFIAQLWSVYVAHSMSQKKKVELTAFDVANMMVMVKQARSVYGNSTDNYVDAAGYTALAASLDPMSELDKELQRGFDDKETTTRITPDGTKAPIQK